MSASGGKETAGFAQELLRAAWWSEGAEGMYLKPCSVGDSCVTRVAFCGPILGITEGCAA